MENSNNGNMMEEVEEGISIKKGGGVEIDYEVN